MKITPLAFDSFGVRSMATFVETARDVKILIDPGAALGPSRYGLPPHPLEIQKLEELGEKIEKFAIKKANILTISHYHYDHYTPSATFYEDKILLIKHPTDHINLSQKNRAKDFLEEIEKKPRKMEFADSQEFVFGKTKVKFSPPCFHGAENSRLGYVLMCSILYKKRKLIHASDIQGPQVKETANWIIKENPDILILSGFPTIFLGWRFSMKSFEESNKNLVKILKKTKVKKIILEHHLLRDLHYQKKIAEVMKKAKELDKEIITAAEFLGRRNEFLEAKRKELYSTSSPPSS